MCATDDSLVSVQTVSHLFPFSVRNRVLWSSYVQTLDTICVIENRDSFFFSRHAQLPLGLWLRALQCEWISILLRTQGFFFFFSRHAQLPLGLWLRALQCEWISILLRTPSLLDLKALRFSSPGQICCKGNPENQVQCDCSSFIFLL